MITKVTDKSSTEQVLSLMHPVVSEWFRVKFGEVTESQALAVPIIHSRKNVLVSSPTGSGKTLTAFLSILNELILLDCQGKLEDRIYAVYVSPLKALANDINENLLKPLAELSALFEAKGLPPPRVKVAVRTGDTPPSERQKQARSPPHIFITTPESLSLVLATPVFSKRFAKVEHLIVDEIHEICDSKRGVALSVALERLQSYCPYELVRIGLSATVAPVEQVAEYLVGLRDGAPREVSIVEVFAQRSLDLEVLCPVKDMTSLSFEVVNSKMYDLLKEMIEGHRTTLVFTNTRSGAESVVYKLKERGLEMIGAHHGSLSREARMDVEGSLRNGLLKAAVSSTSLELGIDIGYIDLVVQIGSPKSVAKGLQRVGRAGHQYRGTSKGRIVVFENDDLVECAVLCRAAHRKSIDRVTIPMNSLDVLAQTLVGMSIERRWTFEEAYSLLRRSYCYRELAREQLSSVLKYLGGKEEFEGIYSKLWFDDKEGIFGKKRGSRMIYYLNQGTIPEEADYKVYSERGSHIGSLSEKFVERLTHGDIFVLGGRSYEFIKSKGTKAFVKSASGRKPTVPSWTGEMLPRSYDLSVLVAKFRGEMEDRIGTMQEKDIVSWLMDEFDVDEGSATTILNYSKEQQMVAKLPTNTRLVIEGYVDATGNKSAIFHFPFGRRVNDALSRAYAHALSQSLKSNVTVSVTDDSFMLTASRSFRLEDLGGMLTSSSLESVLKAAVRGSELFNQRFRHTATRSFMVLRNYKGKELSVARQQLRSSRLLDALHELEDFPVMAETYHEILTEVMDIEHAKEVLASLESQSRRLEYIPFSGVPSPFAHNVILVGVSDIVLMEDRSMLLRELHRKVLARVLGSETISEYEFDPETVEQYFAAKFPRIASKQEILDALRRVGPMNLFREKGESIYGRSQEPFENLRSWAADLLREGKVQSVWNGEDVYVASEDFPVYACVHRRQTVLEDHEKLIMSTLSAGQKTQHEIMEATGLSKEDVRDSLRRLESANEVSRTDMKGEAFRFALATLEPKPRKDCLSEAITRHLAFHAPISIEDLAYEVGITEADAEQILRELMAGEVVVAGRFVVGEQQQYMLARDYLSLKSKGEPVFDRETVRAFHERKHFSRVPSVKAFFEKFGEAGMVYDLFQRVDGFDLEEFGELRKSGEILLGRFVRGRLRYVLADDAPYYLGVYRRERMDKYEASLLKTLQKIGSGTYLELAAASGFPSDIMRDRFDSLDRKGHLLRLYDEAESWSSRNVYSACDIEPEEEQPFDRVVKRYLRGYGPVTLLQAASYLDVEPQDARALLEQAGAKVIRVGLERTEMFALPDELRDLECPVLTDDKMRVLSLYDPFLSDKWTEVTSRFGEGWIFPLVRRGAIVGMVEKWLLAGAVEIRQIELDDPGLLGELIDAFDGMMKFYLSLGVDIIRVRNVFGSDVQDLGEDILSVFRERGYELVNGMLAKGRLVTPCFEPEDVVSAVFSLQNIGPDDKLVGMEGALERYGGLRSDVEALLRVGRFESLQRLHRKGAVVKGHLVPDRVGFCRPEEAGLYRCARAGELSSDEKLVLRIVGDQQPVGRDRLLELSPLGHGDTVEALKSLYTSSRLYMDGSHSYVTSGKRRCSRDIAWKQIILRMFDNWGIMTAESLAFLLGHEIRMREIRRVLRSLEDDGLLVKGYLVSGSGTLHWVSTDAFEKLGKTRFTSSFVLSPEDNLTQYLKASFRVLLPEAGRYAVFRGTTLIGSFAGRVRAGKLEVSDLRGESDCDEIVASYAKSLGLALADREEGRVSDWEIMDFFQKSHPGMSSR